MNKQQCPRCGSARLLDAYIPCRPFKGWYCQDCEEVGEFWGPIRKLLWDLFVYWRWHGEVLVKEPDGAAVTSDPAAK